MSPVPGLLCSYLGCTSPAEAEIMPQYPGRSHPRVLRCPSHLPATEAAYAMFDNRGTSGTTVVAL